MEAAEIRKIYQWLRDKNANTSPIIVIADGWCALSEMVNKIMMVMTVVLVMMVMVMLMM